MLLEAAPAQRQRNGGDSLSKDLLGGLYDERPSDPELIADKCRQIGNVRRDPAAISEPLYHAITGVIVHCTDGEAFLHRYTSAEWHHAVDEKLNRAEVFGHPTTCEHFRNLNPKDCIGCPFSGRITTPLELGRHAYTRNEKPVNGTASLSNVMAVRDWKGESIRVPPSDFMYDDKGSLFLVTESKTGQPVYDLVCFFPTYLNTVQTDELDNSRHTYHIRTFKPHDGWADVVISARQAAARDAVAEFAGRGIIIDSAEGWRKYLKEASRAFSMSNVLEMRYDQFGWKAEDKAFLVGRRMYTSTEIKMVNGNDTLQQRAQYFEFPKSRTASLERWQRAANKMFAKGLEHQSLAILCGFAAPIMRFHAGEEGGAIVSLVSSKTGSGKTSALEAAASIWGTHRGLRLDDSDTRVAKGLKLGLLGNLPCTFDELYERDPAEIRKFIMTFTNGSDKDRGTIEGNLRNNRAEWQTILLLASNISIVDALATFGDGDATTSRVFEINTTLPNHTSKDDFDAIRRELAYNHSFAGDFYLKKLLQPECIEWIKRKIPECTAYVQHKANLETKHRFWTRMIVSVIIAGTIVSETGLLDFDVERIRDWLLDLARKQRNQIIDNSQVDVGDYLGHFLNAHVGNTLVVDHTYYPGRRILIERPPIGKVFARYETQDKRLLVDQKVMKKWLTSEGIMVKDFVDTLLQKGVMLGEGRKHTLGAGTPLAGHQVQCYVFNMEHPSVTGHPVLAEKAYPSELPPES